MSERERERNVTKIQTFDFQPKGAKMSRLICSSSSSLILFQKTIFQMKVENPHHGGWRKFEQQKFWTIRLLISPPPLCKLFFQFQADASAMLPMKLPTRTLFIASVNNDQTTRQQLHLQVQIVPQQQKKV